MHTRHCPRHVFAAPPAHFSGVNVMRGRVARGLYAAERTRGLAKEAGRVSQGSASEFREKREGSIGGREESDKDGEGEGTREAS